MHMNLRAQNRLFRRLVCLLTVCCALLSPHVFAQDKQGAQGKLGPSSVTAPHLKVSLVSDKATLPADGAATHIGLLFDLQPEWHIYWTTAGDSGEPPEVKWTLPAGVSAAPLEFPAPKRLPLGP